MRNFLASMALRTLLLAPFLLLPSPGWSQADEQSDRQAFRDFLTQAKNNGSADKEKVAAFYKTSGAFWRAHWLDYSHHPENYADVMALYRADQALYPRAQEARDPERYRKDIELFKEFDSKNAPPQKRGPVRRQFDDHEVEDRRCLSRPQRDQPRIRRECPRRRAVFLQGRDRKISSRPPSCSTATMTSRVAAIPIRPSRRSCRSTPKFDRTFPRCRSFS